MDKKMIEEIVSNCGYEALGLYIYLYSIRDKESNVTMIDMDQIANEGAYFDTTTLLESIDDLKDFEYLVNEGNLYAFPKSADYTNVIREYQEFQKSKI